MQVTQRILERLFDNTVAVKYNYTGKGGKEALKPLNHIIEHILRKL